MGGERGRGEGGLDDAREGARELADLVGRDDVLRRLDAWLDEAAVPVAQIIAENGRGKSAVLARWSRALVGEGRADVVTLSIGREQQTVLERDALPLLYEALKRALAPGQSVDLTPRTPRGARLAIGDMLFDGRKPEERPLVVILDGADQAVDWAIDAEPALFTGIGPGVRIVVAGERPIAWNEGATLDIDLPRLDDSALVPSFPGREALVPILARLTGGDPLLLNLYEEALASRAAERAESVAAALHATPAGLDGWLSRWSGVDLDAIRPWLQRLSYALGPIRSEELTRDGEDPAASALRCASPRLLRALPDGRYVYRHERIRAHIAECMTSTERHEVQAGYLARGRGGLREHASSPYFIRHYRAHLEQADAALDDFAALVSPAWREAWRTLPDAFEGLLADVRRVRERAGERLGAGDDRSAGVAIAVRCALVEASLHTLVNPPRGKWESRPPVDAQIDFDRRVDDGGARALVLVTLAQALPSPTRAEVLGWAYRAAHVAADGEGLLAVARSLSEHSVNPRRTAVAREAVDVFRASGDDRFWVSRALLDVAELLPEAEGRALVREAFERSSEATRYGVSFWHLASSAAQRPAYLVDAIWECAESLPDSDRMQCIARLAPHLSQKRRAAGVDESYALTLSLLRSKGSGTDVDTSFAALAPALSREQICDALAAAPLPGPEPRCSFAERLAELGYGEEAIRLAQDTSWTEHARFEERARLLGHLGSAARSALAAELVAELQRLDGGTARVLLLGHASELALGVAPAELISLTENFDPGSTMMILAELSDAAPPDLRARLLADAAAIGRDVSLEEEGHTLFWWIDRAAHLDLDDAAVLFNRMLEVLLQGSPTYHRRAMLRGPEFDFARLVPLIGRIAGEAGIHKAAEEIERVAAWYP